MSTERSIPQLFINKKTLPSTAKMINIKPSEKLKEKIHACMSSLQKLGMAVKEVTLRLLILLPGRLIAIISE